MKHTRQETSPPGKKWAPKSRTGCRICRQRRVKCDEGRPQCARCSAYGAACPGYEEVKAGNIYSAQQLSRLHTLKTGAVIGMIDQTSPHTRQERRVLLPPSPQSEACMVNGKDGDEAYMGVPLPTHIYRLALGAGDTIDPFGTSAIGQVPEALEILGFWRTWTEAAPGAQLALTASINHETSLSALLAINALIMQYLRLDQPYRHLAQVLLLKSLRGLRLQLAQDPAFFHTEAGLNTLSWMMLATWFQGDVHTLRIHLRGLMSTPSAASLRMETLPTYILENLVYCDFVSSMVTLSDMVIGHVPPRLIMKHVPHPEPSIGCSALADRVRVDIARYEHRTHGHSLLRECCERMLAATCLCSRMADGELALTCFPNIMYGIFDALTLVFPFAFAASKDDAIQNETAFIGTIMLVWLYGLVSPLGVMNSGGLLVYSDEVLARLPRKYVPRVAKALRQLNELGLEARAAVNGADSGITIARASMLSASILAELVGTEVSSVGNLVATYVQHMLNSPLLQATAEAALKDHRLRTQFYGPMVAQFSFLSSF